MENIDQLQMTALKQQIADAAERFSAAGMDGDLLLTSVSAQIAKTFHIRNNEGLHRLIREIVNG